ncbi:WD repeat and HMG-box DNA-binding protein 1-like [Mya arenaria]|uniref:WD repeat and HMG-box DNA-binding protein 1-like n=1 Tax=Mya arenaria TaxID=6604 RepID=UPI0022E51B72|nr:WD repeat and HMG-box DNA-binding protein 1-like [Mya arenaria]
MPNVKPMRYAHSDGFTDVCFNSDGRYILTGGTDGDVRIWKGIEDDDAISHRCGDKTFAVAIKDNRYFAATDTNVIQAYTFPDGGPDGILTRFTAPANHIVVNKAGTTLVAGANDFMIKIVDVESCSTKTIQGHEAPVLSIALDPKEEFLASSSCDGTVRVWKMEDRSQVVSLPVLPKCSDTSLSRTVCRMCWEPDRGQFLYVPVEKEVRALKRGDWSPAYTFTDACFTECVSVVAVSPDGKYLAAGSYDGWIAIFHVDSRSCVDKHRNEKGISISSMAWNPQNNMELVFCDTQGQLGELTDITTEVSTGKKDKDKGVAAGVFDDEDDDFLIEASNSGNISEDDGVRIAKPAVIFSDDDSMPEMPLKAGDDDDDRSSVTSDRSELPPPAPRVEGYRPTPLQRPFQPGSTPQHLTSRFMMWNAVGIIRQYNTDDENSVDIEFHDTSVHHAMHIPNSAGYTIGDFSQEAVLMAAEGDSDTPSKLTCMHFSSWDNTKEWSLPLPDGEEALALCLGEGWVAVATDRRNVRILTVAGIQKEMFTIPGPVVCMAGHTSQLMIVYHRAMGVPGEQCLGVSVLDIKGWRRELNCEPLPLSPTTTLAWLGFSAEGTPFYMDSEGILRMLNRQAAKSWTQIANMRSHAKGKSDHHWIVSIHENPQQIRCIPCKGSRYPATLPRPAPVVLPFQVPLCELNTEKAQYEELLWRTRLLSGHFDVWERQGYEVDENSRAEASKPAQEALMKLFALSARSEREFRALEVCEMMRDPHTVQLAIKYASRMRYMQLANRISEMASRQAEEEQANVDNQMYEDDYSSQVTGVRQAAVSTQEDEVEMEEEPAQLSGPLLATKIREDKQDRPSNPFKSRSNPFKVSTTPSQSPSLTKGTQVFDSLSKKKEKASSSIFSQEIRSPKIVLKKGGQPKLFQKKKDTSKTTTATPAEKSAPTDKPVTPFSLWLEEAGSELRAENPDKDDDDFNKFAADTFRALPKEEKQGYVQRSKELNDRSKENTGGGEDGTENRKRKREIDETGDASKKLRDEDTDTVKKPLGQTANSKLANFAFKGDS